MEECGEVIQWIGKILRHGYEDEKPLSKETNRAALERELGDLVHASRRMVGATDVSEKIFEKIDRRGKFRFLHHNKE